jgi:hypothetical protein
MMTQPQPDIRDTLFGDMPFEAWASNGSRGEPWISFEAAKSALDGGNRQACIETLTEIVNRQNLEPRHYVQAWHFLRQLGVTPPAEKAKELYGVVVEVGLNGGLDLVAGYADFSARYYNYSGAGVVWEVRDASIDKAIQNLLNAGRLVIAKIGPWEKPRPPAPPEGQARINMLVPSGLHFGQAPLRMLASDPLGGPVITSALALMQELIRKTKK